MKQTLSVAAVAAFLLGWTAAARAESAQPAAGLEVKVTQNTTRLMPYQVFEITFQHQGKYHSPTWDVTIDVTFSSPTGTKAKVGGFFYGSSKPKDQESGGKSQETGGRKAQTPAPWPLISGRPAMHPVNSASGLSSTSSAM